MRAATLALLLVALATLQGCANKPIEPTPRSASQVSAFKRVSPCPSTGERRGKCPGWIVDHIVPLCAGGPDNPGNMQWQTVADAKVKDRDEVRYCRWQRPANLVGYAKVPST